MAKTILLTRAMGSGKSTVLSLGYRALEAHWGPSATIDIDTIQRMVDPRSHSHCASSSGGNSSAPPLLRVGCC